MKIFSNRIEFIFLSQRLLFCTLTNLNSAFKYTKLKPNKNKLENNVRRKVNICVTVVFPYLKQYFSVRKPLGNKNNHKNPF